jgi:hypothetical protein
MGEKQDQPFHLSFNASLKVDFQGSRVTPGRGLILVRELEKKTFLRNGFEKPNLGPWDFQVTAEKAMQSRTWLEG